MTFSLFWTFCFNLLFFVLLFCVSFPVLFTEDEPTCANLRTFDPPIEYKSCKNQAFDRVIPSIGLYRSPYRQLTRSRRIETAVLPELQGYEPPSKRETINGSQENLNTSQKSNDYDNVELVEHLSAELRRTYFRAFA